MDKPTILLIILNCLLLFLVFFTRSRKKLSNFFLVLATLLLTLSVVELIYRLFIENETYYGESFNKEFFEPDSLLGYKMERAGKFDAVKVNSKNDTLFHTSYTIVADTGKTASSFPHRVGYHNTADSNELIFLGCSFTFGEGLTDQQSLPYLVGEQNERNSLNLGCTGYGIHQVYQLYLQKYLQADNHGRTFIYSFLYDHILRANGVYDWNQAGPYFVSKGDSIISMGPLKNRRSAATSKFIHFTSLYGSLRFLKKILSHMVERNRLSAMDKTDYNNSLQLLKKLAQLIKVSGGKLIVIDWDANNWGNVELNKLPYQSIESYLDELTSLGVRLVRVSAITNIQDPENFIPGDGHPNAWMNYKIANQIGHMIQPETGASVFK